MSGAIACSIWRRISRDSHELRRSRTACFSGALHFLLRPGKQPARAAPSSAAWAALAHPAGLPTSRSRPRARQDLELDRHQVSPSSGQLPSRNSDRRAAPESSALARMYFEPASRTVARSTAASIARTNRAAADIYGRVHDSATLSTSSPRDFGARYDHPVAEVRVPRCRHTSGNMPPRTRSRFARACSETMPRQTLTAPAHRGLFLRMAKP